jgi:hypothetical protein
MFLALLHSKFRKKCQEEQKDFIQKFNMGIKNAESQADFKSFEKL